MSVTDLAEVLVELEDVKKAVQDCADGMLDDSKPEVGMDGEEDEDGNTSTGMRSQLELVTLYLVDTYMNMRSRDFVRGVMGKGRRSLKQGTRPTLAVLADGRVVRRENYESKECNKDKQQWKSLVCFFCKEPGHSVTVCPAALERPKPGDAACKTIQRIATGDDAGETGRRAPVAESFDWYFCEDCNRWNTHKTEQHAAFMAAATTAQQTKDSDNDKDMENLTEEDDVVGANAEECEELNVILESLHSLVV